MSNIITVREDLIENINEIDPFDILTSSGIIYRHIAPDGRSYIGRTSRRYYDRVTHSPWISYEGSPKFAKAIEKFGWGNFTHEILAYGITDPQQLADLEYYYIKQFDSVHNGYNSISQDIYPISGADLWIVFEEDQLYEEYITQGKSLSELAEEYGTTSANIYHYIKKYEIPSHSKGYASKKVQDHLDKSWKRNREEIPCENCGKMFLPEIKKRRFCSRECVSESLRGENYNPGKCYKDNRGKRVRIDYSSMSSEEEKRVREQRKEDGRKKMEGNKNAIGNTGWKISGHNRFHKGRYPNIECEVCLEENPDLMTRDLVDLKEAARKLGITRGELQGILKRKDLWFYNKHTPSDKLIGSNLIVKTGNRSHRDNFLWDVDKLRKIIRK